MINTQFEGLRNSVFILGDRPKESKVIKVVLENRLKIDCILFHDPVSLLDNVSNDKPAVVIVDFQGNMRGDKIITKLREDNESALVIVVSEDTCKDTMSLVLNSGANNIILRESLIALPSLIMSHLQVRNSPRYTDTKGEESAKSCTLKGIRCVND